MTIGAVGGEFGVVVLGGMVGDGNLRNISEVSGITSTLWCGRIALGEAWGIVCGECVSQGPSKAPANLRWEDDRGANQDSSHVSIQPVDAHQLGYIS